MRRCEAFCGGGLVVGHGDFEREQDGGAANCGELAHRACAGARDDHVGGREAVRQTGVRAVAVVGGVSANRGLRAAMTEAGAADGFEVFIPDPDHSVDNAAMIAVTAARKWAAGETSDLGIGATPSMTL